jgi:hypothetical protein
MIFSFTIFRMEIGGLVGKRYGVENIHYLCI